VHRKLTREIRDTLKKTDEILEESKQAIADLQALIAKTNDLLEQSDARSRIFPTSTGCLIADLRNGI